MGIIEAAHNVKILGSGEGVIVLAHGFGTDQSVWRRPVPYLVQDYKVVLYHNMGAGTTNPDYFDFTSYSMDQNTFGGFEQEDIEQIFEGLRSNYEAWCAGFAPLVVGADMNSVALQEFCRTLFNMRPDSLGLANVIFPSDMRHILPLVSVHCHILQSMRDVIMPVGGHLPQLSLPDIVIPAPLRQINSN